MRQIRTMLMGSALSGVAGVVLCIAPGGSAHAAPVYRQVTDQAGIDARFLPNGYPGENSVQTGSAAVGDFNNDGWPDLFIPQGGTGPDRLYINQQDGTFRDEAPAWGVDRRTRAAGLAVGDFDNDGYNDIFVVNYGDFPFPLAVGRSILYRNTGPDAGGQFRFEDVAEQAGVNRVADFVGGLGATFGDMDLDGDLDLFVSAWIFNIGGNRLFENNGDGTFTRVPEAQMPAGTATVRGFTPNFADLNGDRYPELLLTNDFRTSRLYRNAMGEGGMFEDITAEAGVVVDCNGMGATLADFDNDGRLDWFMTNIYIEFSSPPCANTLYRGTSATTASGVPVFEELAVARGVGNSGWGWGCTAFDADNDGDPDLATTGGWPAWINEPARLYINNGSGVFSNQALQSGLAWLGQGRGLVHLDYDRDGRVDLLFIDNGNKARLYRNESTNTGNWLRIDLDTDASPCLAPDGFGARVTVAAGGVSRTQIADGRTSFLSQSERTMHFGLGGSAQADSVEVAWSDGSVTTLAGIGANQTVRIEPTLRADLDASGGLNFFDIYAFFGLYAAQDARADFDDDGSVTVADINAYIARYLSPCG